MTDFAVVVSGRSHILQATGRMAAGINCRATDDQRLIDPPAPQAVAMHFGVARGEFGAKRWHRLQEPVPDQ